MEEYTKDVVRKEDLTKNKGLSLLNGCQTNIIVRWGVLAYQEVSCLEDTVSKEADDSLDVWSHEI